MKQELIDAATELLHIASSMDEEGVQVKKIVWVFDEMVYLGLSDFRQTLQKWYLTNAPVGYEITIKKKKAKSPSSSLKKVAPCLVALALGGTQLPVKDLSLNEGAVLVRYRQASSY